MFLLLGRVPKHIGVLTGQKVLSFKHGLLFVSGGGQVFEQAPLPVEVLAFSGVYVCGHCSDSFCVSGFCDGLLLLDEHVLVASLGHFLNHANVSLFLFG